MVNVYGPVCTLYRPYLRRNTLIRNYTRRIAYKVRITSNYFEPEKGVSPCLACAFQRHLHNLTLMTQRTCIILHDGR